MLSSKMLKDIVAEARPIIERQLDDAERIAGFRDLVSANGGDWGALKALLKAQIQDERDDAGGNKRVQKILDKADYSTAYADMLGLANMNEQNFSSDDLPHDDDGVIEEGDEPAATSSDGAGAAAPSLNAAPATPSPRKAAEAKAGAA